MFGLLLCPSPRHSAALEICLGKETDATMDSGAPSALLTRTARRGRDVRSSPVSESETLSALLTQTALAPRSAGSGSAGFDGRGRINYSMFSSHSGFAVKLF